MSGQVAEPGSKTSGHEPSVQALRSLINVAAQGALAIAVGAMFMYVYFGLMPTS